MVDQIASLISKAIKAAFEQPPMTPTETARECVRYMLADQGLTLNKDNTVTSNYSKQIVAWFVEAGFKGDDLIYKLKLNQAMEFVQISVDAL
jgi:hypothetical protein